MSLKKHLDKKKNVILPELYFWAESFNPENMFYNKETIDEEKEIDLYNSYHYVLNLFKKFERGKCNKYDYENILFHIYQINYDEIIISL